MSTQDIVSKRMVYTSMIVGLSALICFAIIAQAQYNTFDSDSNSDSDENPTFTNAELGKLVRGSAKAHRRANNNNNNLHNNQYQQQLATATRNLYNRQQPMQYAPTHNRRNYGSSSELSRYGPNMGSASNGRESNNDNDDDESSAFGPNFNSNNEDGEGSGADNQPMNLNQAASGYPAGQNDYSNDGVGAGFNFGGASGYGPSSDGSEYGPSDGFGTEGRRYKSASSPSNSRNFGGSDDDAGALQYGPNSAINAGEVDDEGRSGYAPEGQNDNDNDDE